MRGERLAVVVVLWSLACARGSTPPAQGPAATDGGQPADATSGARADAPTGTTEAGVDVLDPDRRDGSETGDTADGTAVEGGGGDGAIADAAGAAPPDGPGALQRCGSSSYDLSNVAGVSGMLVAADGTMFVTRVAGHVGRRLPGRYNSDPWVLLPPDAGIIKTLALDLPRRRLYIAAPDAAKIYALDLSFAPPPISVLLRGVAANGMTIGPDGQLYYGDRDEGHVYRVLPTGERTRVTTSPIPAGAPTAMSALAFSAGGDLFVPAYPAGVIRLTLANGAETGRSNFVSSDGSYEVRGLAFDDKNRIYIATQYDQVLQIPIDGSQGSLFAQSTLQSYGWSAIAFGVGDLRCSDLFIGGDGQMLYEVSNAAGLRLPWQAESLPTPVRPPPVPPPAAGTASLSGVDLAKEIVALTDDELAKLCDWSAQASGGYGVERRCGSAQRFINPYNQQGCVAGYDRRSNCVATVAQAEECLGLRARDICAPDWLDSPACLSLLTCQH